MNNMLSATNADMLVQIQKAQVYTLLLVEVDIL